MQPEVDLWCPGAVASAIHLTRAGSLYTAQVMVTVRLELDTEKAQIIADRYLENVMHVSMDELTAWPVADETLKRPDGVRVQLPRVDARMRVHRLEGAREPLQDLPFEVETLSVDRDKRLADAGLRADFTFSDANAKLIVLVGVALGQGSIHWPSRDQVVAERALSGSHMYSTHPKAPAIPKEDPRLATPPPATQLPKPKAPRRRASRRPPPPRRRSRADSPGTELIAVTLDPEDAITLDDVDAPATLDEVDAVTDSQQTESIQLDGTVMIPGNDRPPPSQRMAITVDNRTQLAAWTVPWMLQGKYSLTVAVKATCDLAGDGTPAVLRDAAESPRGDDFLNGDPAGTLLYPSDHALLKHRCDVVLMGRAYAPAGRASRSTVTFRFGAGTNAFERHIAVFGAREWRDGTPSPPQLFRSIPLVYERAFGGPGFARNPVGVGFGDGHRGRFVPSLEDPASPLERRGEQRRPVCPAPLSPSWQRRRDKVGHAWRSHLEETWDDLPDDFDWEYFQCAPRPQQLDYLDGGETFEVLGVRPSDAPLRGQLPSITPKCTASGQRAARAVSLHLDTVVIDAETMTLHLLWRGLLSVSAPNAPEISALVVTA